MQQKFFLNPFAVAGDKAAVPETSSGGSLSYSTGYTANYSLQLGTAGALQIQREQDNQVLFDVTNGLANLQAFGCPEFINSSNNGGSAFAYGLGAVVRYSTSGTAPFNTYISVVGGNTSTPPSIGWRQIAGPLATATDCNSANLGIMIASPSTANTPVSSHYGLLETESSNGQATPESSVSLTQFFYDTTMPGDIWYRAYNGTAYTAWAKIGYQTQITEYSTSSGPCLRAVEPGTNGLITLTGTFVANAGNVRTYQAFSTAFPTQCCGVIVSYQASTPPNSGAIGADGWTAAGFYYANSAATGSNGCTYIAVGY